MAFLEDRQNRSWHLYGVLFAALSTLLFSCRAAPPVDIVGEDAAAGRNRVLTEDDLVYTNNSAPLPDISKELAAVKIPIVGRSLPSRKGRPLFRLQKGERVKVMKASNNGRWMAILSLSKRRRAWVPKSALILPEPSEAETSPGGGAPLTEQPLQMSPGPGY